MIRVSNVLIIMFSYTTGSFDMSLFFRSTSQLFEAQDTINTESANLEMSLGEFQDEFEGFLSNEKGFNDAYRHATNIDTSLFLTKVVNSITRPKYIVELAEKFVTKIIQDVNYIAGEWVFHNGHFDLGCNKDWVRYKRPNITKTDLIRLCTKANNAKSATHQADVLSSFIRLVMHLNDVRSNNDQKSIKNVYLASSKKENMQRVIDVSLIKNVANFSNVWLILPFFLAADYAGKVQQKISNLRSRRHW